MTELIFNTESSTKKVVEEKVLPLKLVEPFSKFLSLKLPEYDVSKLPNNIISNLIERMKMTMKLYNGVGLSANQCGISERFFIMGTEHFQMTCINPKILNFIGEKKKIREGCLTYTGLFLYVQRYPSVEVEYYTESGEKKTHTFDGITAQIFQHEMEHMDGTVFTSHVGPLALKMAKDRQYKLFEKAKRRMK